MHSAKVRPQLLRALLPSARPRPTTHRRGASASPLAGTAGAHPVGQPCCRRMCTNQNLQPSLIAESWRILAAGRADIFGSGLHPAVQPAARGCARRLHQPCSEQPGRAARGRRHRQRVAAAAGTDPAQVPAPEGASGHRSIRICFAAWPPLAAPLCGGQAQTLHTSSRTSKCDGWRSMDDAPKTNFLSRHRQRLPAGAGPDPAHQFPHLQGTSLAQKQDLGVGSSLGCRLALTACNWIAHQSGNQAPNTSSLDHIRRISEATCRIASASLRRAAAPHH